ncbi:MAG: hypothetical protein HOP30_15935 [Cyclobacteriaceae bacterium]|nr:hypothetical protein [Cyclobacteriaceae bacterium]
MKSFYFNQMMDTPKSKFDLNIKTSGYLKKILLHHLPYLTPTPPDKYSGKFNKYRPKDDGQWLLCGHIHEVASTRVHD